METLALSKLPSQVIHALRNDEAALEKKLDEIGIFTGTNGSQPPFWESMAVTMPLEKKLDDSLALDDLKRERKFAELATASVHIGLERLRRSKVKFRRPKDYFAEMVKNDSQMAKVKARILHEKEKIETAEKRRNNREIKKNKKKVRGEQMEREQDKKRRAKEEIETVSRLRKQRLQERAQGNRDQSDDDDEFPIDLLEVEQLDSKNIFQRNEEIASGKKKAWRPKGHAKDARSRKGGSEKDSWDRKGERGVNGKKAKSQRKGGPRKKTLKASGGVKKRRR